MELRQYLAIARKWWWLMIISTVLAAGTGYFFSQRQTPVYQATTTLMVGQSIQSTDLTSADMLLSERLASTYANVARRQPVLQAVVDTLSLRDSFEGLRSRVTVNPVRDTQLLEITVQASSREEARVTADEVARQLILLSPTTLEDREMNENQRVARERLNSLQDKIDAGQARLQELEAAMQEPLSTQQAQDIQAEINTLEGLISNWESNHTELLVFIESGRSPNYLTVVEPAQVGSSPIRPRTRQDTLLAGVVGLLLSLGVIFLIEYLDDTLKSPDDMLQQLGLVTLGAVGTINGKPNRDKLIAQEEPFSPISEAYRMIRSNLQFMAVDRPLRAIMVTSPLSSEGKSVTVANLGVVMAQAGLKTIIVDTDLRRPVQHQLFHLPNQAGVTELLRAPELEINGHLADTGVENLKLLTSGEIPPNPSELLGSRRMDQLLRRLTDLADVVIFDSPPVLAVADATVLSKRVDGLVLVAEAGQTRLAAARQAIINLQQAGANVLGGVLNRVSGKGGGYYYYYSSYHHYSPNGGGLDGRAGRAEKKAWWRELPFPK
jgi:capsular exopolysaccharide synthesis family protein